jgi:hypothetical protein
MSSILTINHYVDKANTFIESIKSTNTAYYVYTARPQPWANSSGDSDDTAIQAVNTSVAQVELEVYRDLLYGKLIGNTDVIHVVPRYSWASNTVYANYDQSDASLYTKNFFVITTGLLDQYNVFKCIDNASGTPSTVKPTLQATKGTFTTGDGYTWKYMYTIDITANTKFTSSSFIPVTPNNDVISNSTPGTIDIIRIANGGTGYSVVESGILQSIVDSINVKLPDTSSSFNNYYSNSTIYLKSGFGAGQVREIVSYDGITKTATLAQPVDNYLRLDFANAQLITGGGVGEIVSQTIDTVTYTASVGSLNPGDTIIQTDTGVAASVLAANTTSLKVSRTNKTQSLLANSVLRSSADTGVLKTDKVNISNSSILALGIVVDSGSGYTSNATITITSNTGAGAVANGTANATGKIASINIANTGTGYLTEPAVTVSAPTAQTFNANTAVVGGTDEGANNVISIATANVYVAGDRIRYTTSAGNTVITGLSNNTTYFVQFANSTVVALSNSSNTAAGNRIQLTPASVSATGHTLQGISATARILPRALYATNTAANATFTGEYANGDFFRVGEDANNNNRQIQSVNSTVIIVNRSFANTISSANTFKLATAILPTSVSINEANGTISNTNLDSITLTIANTSIPGSLFITGEKVQLVDSANLSLNANGTIAYSNTSTLYISGILGTWVAGQRVRGNSSELVADIVTIDTRPNVTLKNPAGTFLTGQNVDFRTTTGSNTGIASLVASVNLTQNSIEYDIGPTVKVSGDGQNAIAVATVNTAIGSGNAVSRITMINTGLNYTTANVQIYANTLYGSGAAGTPVISPILGHGADAVLELGGRYAAITTKFNSLANESWYYPSTTSFRKIGIINTPVFANLTLTTADYTRVKLDVTSQVGSWTNNEVVVQNTSNATGIVVSGNSSVLNLKNVRGTFVTANTLYGYSSGTTANVALVTTLVFAADENVTQETTGATARVVTAVGNTVYVANVTGQLANGSTIIGSTSTAEATITEIKSADDLKNLSASFAQRFNQTSRLTLSSLIGTFQPFEYIEQANSNANAVVINTSSDLDLTIGSLSGSFSIGETITNANTSANAKIVYANSSYLKLTSVSNTALFTTNNSINNGIGSNAVIQSVRNVLVVADVQTNFQPGLLLVTGANSGAQATVSIVTNPDLVRNTGKVIYTETSNSVINRTTSSTEEIRLTIKF